MFNWLFKKSRGDAAQPVRDILFGDLPLSQWPGIGVDTTSYPWSEFASARSEVEGGRVQQALEKWLTITKTPGLEPRHYLQAWQYLRDNKVEPPEADAKTLHGVVVEVSLTEGLDLLAAYADRSARYFNFSGAGVVWDRPDSSLDPLIDRLLAASSEVLENIGPWEGKRPGPPPSGAVRLTFLTPSGIHFGQGPMEALSQDPLAAPVFHGAAALMQALIEKHSQRQGPPM